MALNASSKKTQTAENAHKYKFIVSTNLLSVVNILWF